MGTGDRTPEASTATSWQWAGVVAVVVLLIGLAASAGGALVWSRAVRQQADRAFSNTADSAANALANAIERNADLTGTAKVLFGRTPGLDQRAFSSWFAALSDANKYPGSFALLHVSVVGAGQLGAFLAAAGADPPFGIVATPGPAGVAPPGARAPYCLIDAGVIELTPALQKVALRLRPLLGLARYDEDLCDLPIGRLLRLSASSGHPTAIALGRLVREVHARMPSFLRDAGLVLTMVPVYGGADPGSSSPGPLQGWVLGVFEARAILGPVLRHYDLSARLTYRNPDGAVVGVYRSGTPRGAFSTTVALKSAGPWVVTFSGAAETSGLSAGAQGLVVLLGGALGTLLLYLLLRTLVRSRSRALQLVARRTEQLRHQALHDTLTGLPNRALIFQRAEEMLVRARRGLTEVSVLYVDLDRFKDVNDTFGHGAGDGVLRQVAERFSTLVRGTDTVGRLGGDEFVVLLEDPVDRGRPRDVARRVLASLRDPFPLGGDHEGATIFLSASIGIATGLRPQAELLISDADIALYEAKANAAGGFVTFAPDMRVAVTRRLQLETELRDALAADQFFLVFQPIFDLGTGEALGCEALVRWRHPERGVVMPAEFVPVLEATGMVLDLGRWVLDRACEQVVQWQQVGYAGYVSVNVSARQLEREEFVVTVADALARSGCPPWRLVLEITETTLMGDSERSTRRLGALKATGCRIAVDDFGTGYCSLAYLQRFPVDALKVDQSFVRQMETSADSANLVRTIIQLGRDLRLAIVAEGIETESQLGLLRADGCTAGQGFLFSRPVEAEDLLASIERPRGGAAARGVPVAAADGDDQHPTAVPTKA